MTDTIDTFVESVNKLLEQAGVDDPAKRGEYVSLATRRLQEKVLIDRTDARLFAQRRQPNSRQELVDITPEHQTAYKASFLQTLGDYVDSINKNKDIAPDAYARPGITKERIGEMTREAMRETGASVRESYRR